MRARLEWIGLALWAALTLTGLALSFAKGQVTDAAIAHVSVWLRSPR